MMAALHVWNAKGLSGEEVAIPDSGYSNDAQ